MQKVAQNEKKLLKIPEVAKTLPSNLWKALDLNNAKIWRPFGGFVWKRGNVASFSEAASILLFEIKMG